MSSAVELLGFHIGPAMGGSQWKKPTAKYRNRGRDIKFVGAPTSLNVYDYNARVLPALSYICQLVTSPADLAFAQRVALHTVYHAPFNTFAHSVFLLMGRARFAQGEVWTSCCLVCVG